MDSDKTRKYTLASRLTDDEAKMLEKFRNLSEDKKKEALELINNALYSEYSDK